MNDGGTGKQVATLSPGNGAEYGPSTKLIIRVWLEGEDPNCWNQNAGQNFNISLKFSKTAVTPPATKIVAANTLLTSADGSLMDGARVTVNSGSDVLVFEYNSTATPKWDLIDGTFHRDTSKTYTFQGVEVTNTDQIAAKLDAMGTKADTFASALSVSDGT